MDLCITYRTQHCGPEQLDPLEPIPGDDAGKRALLLQYRGLNQDGCGCCGPAIVRFDPATESTYGSAYVLDYDLTLIKCK